MTGYLAGGLFALVLIVGAFGAALVLLELGYRLVLAHRRGRARVRAAERSEVGRRAARARARAGVMRDASRRARHRAP